MLQDAALLRHRVIGNCDPGHPRNLKRERAAIGQAAFSQLVTAKIPQDLQPSFESGLQSAEDA